MTRREFLDQVLLPLRGLTGDERETVRREMEEHIEDRMEALLEMGWAEELAEARSLEAMGDPAEIGRELAAQYKGRGWVWLENAALLFMIALGIQALLAFGMLGFALDSITARIAPEARTNLDVVEAAMPVDVRIPVGNDVLRVVQVSTGRDWGEEGLRAELSLCSYDRIPGGVVSGGLMRCVRVENQRGEPAGGFGGGSGHYMRETGIRYADIEPGDTYVTLVYRRFGENIRIRIPLPEEGAP